MTAEVARALLVWPVTASLATIFGTAAFALLSPSDGTFDLQAAASMLRLWRVLASVIFVGSPLVLLNVATGMAGVSWRRAMAFLPQVLAETHAGKVFEWFLPTTLVLLLTAYVPLAKSARTAMLFLLAGVLFLLQALLSHAIDHGAMAVASYFLHEIAAALWVGALVGLWMGARYGDPPSEWVQRAARRVSMLAFWSVIALVLTGTYIASNELGLDLHQVVFSAYGRTLITKVIVFAGVLVIGGYNRYWLMPNLAKPIARGALLRNVEIESAILLVAAVGLASLLANTQPAHRMRGHLGHARMVMIVGSEGEQPSAGEGTCRYRSLGLSAKALRLKNRASSRSNRCSNRLPRF